MKYTEEQQTIIDAARAGTRSLFVNAVAGSGKTTVLAPIALNSVCRGRRTLAVTFMSSMADQLREKLSGGVTIKTFNALGQSAIYRGGRRHTTKDLKLVASKGRVIARKVAANFFRRRRSEMVARLGENGATLASFALRRELPRLMMLAQNTLPRSKADVLKLVQSGRFDTISNIAPEDWADLAIECLQRSVAEFRDEGTFDFGDQLYLPAKLNLWPMPYDQLILDEAQDTGSAAASLARKAAAQGASAVIVGDPMQAIFGFRGAETKAFKALKTTFSAQELPMTNSFRCGHEIAAFVRQRVPGAKHFQAFAANNTGAAMSVDFEQFVGYGGVAPGDFVISRTNAPLFALAAFWVRKGLPVTIRGKELRGALRGDIAALREASKKLGKPVRALFEEQAARAAAAAEEDRLHQFDADRLVVLENALIAGQWDLKEAERWIESALSADWGSAITCSTVHGVKGDEASRVWVLKSTFDGLDESDERQRLLYTAYTRARDALIVVGAPPRELTGRLPGSWDLAPLHQR